MNQATEAELEEISNEAQSLVNVFWEEVKSKRESNEFSGSLGLRVRRIRNSIQIVWYENKWYGTGNKKRMFSKQIQKGKGYMYSPDKFKKMQQWERDAVGVLEEKFGQLRKRIEVLGRIRRQVSAYKQIKN
ncbi:conjugative transfer protein MobI(A/C) [Piscirickettsia litoralis]|uniref:conjugative transfer protein MobI(A/C) n=1 Tax=Piscirickettsia litoralis TaxID=1891921 RepID=UPI002286BAB7|nr:conjugative transfer protein MobI(A/C) [Piscirickettsia litoralis]